MFKKLNLTTLAIVFGILLIIVVISQLISNHRGESNFRKQLFEVDSVKISSISIKTKLAKEETLILKDGKNWTVSGNKKTYKVDLGMVRAMVLELYNMKAERLAATDKSEWAIFQVTDTMATHVKVKQGSKVVADFLVGKFSYNQNPQKFNTYIRITGEDEVYAVDGFLAMTFSKRLDDLRNKTLINVNPAQITRLSFSYPADSSFQLVKDKKQWKLNGQDVDSTKVAGFINNISNINGNEFVNDEVKAGIHIYTLKIEGNNFSPVEVNAFTADTVNKFIITSNLNTEGRFSGISSDLVNRVFAGKSRFFRSEVPVKKGGAHKPKK